MEVVVEDLLAKAEATLQRVWGYQTFRPLQSEAIAAALSGRDSLVVLPTGGGKSVCFQVPALCLDGVTIVVSPLISLMKDQVDALEACGVSAAFLNSTQRSDEQRQIGQRIRAGQLKLLYVAPERLLTDRMLDFLRQTRLAMFAIDEAHCISDWGHDFRPEYRGLRTLKERFPQVPVHAYTATAPEHVRQDIVKQLGLADARVLVGSFDRPNLVYRMLPIDGRMQQVADVVSRHRGESGIIYCISRKEVERMAKALCALGVNAVAYHAGMSEPERKLNQEAFIRDRADVVVATIAFGMGIDKPDVRYVVHVGMPKSIENYQQESGRAGRDGLESECVLLYSGADLVTWKSMLKGLDAAADASAVRALNAIYNLCTGGVCRHQALSTYFGQRLDADNCGACDVCLGELDQVDDPITLGQKILSCVLRLEERFGADYTAKVLAGSTEQRIIQLGHDRLSTHGLLKDNQPTSIRRWIEQLVSQGFLAREGEYQTLRVTERGRELLRRQLTPSLTLPVERKSPARRSAIEDQSWEGVDRGLFAHLKQVRGRLANERKVPAYVVFGDTTLRELARVRPSSREALRSIRGIGEQKLKDFGADFLEALDTYCQSEALARDVTVTAQPSAGRPAARTPSLSAAALASFEYFRQHASIAQVAEKMERAQSTVAGYLVEYLQHHHVTDPTPWVKAELVSAIEAAISACSDDRLKPVFEALESKVSYEDIRIVSVCRRNRAAISSSQHADECHPS